MYIYRIYIYHAYASDHVGYAQSQLHCKLVWGETQDNQLMNHLKFQLSSNIQQHKRNVQGAYIYIIVPTAAVLVNAKVTQSTTALPTTLGSIFMKEVSLLKAVCFK